MRVSDFADIPFPYREETVNFAVSIGNGSGDAQGSQRGLEYDTMSGKYAEFVETEVLPLVEKQYNVKLTRNPDARATMAVEVLEYRQADVTDAESVISALEPLTEPIVANQGM